MLTSAEETQLHLYYYYFFVILKPQLKGRRVKNPLMWLQPERLEEQRREFREVDYGFEDVCTSTK